jgi:hypothetical protein
MNRNARIALTIFNLCLSLLVWFGCDWHGEAQTVTRPNILLFIADDWSYPHAGAYGDKVVKTPNFDRVAREGTLFTNAYCAAPSCTPSRASLLTGRAVHQLEEGGNLHGFLPTKFERILILLEKRATLSAIRAKVGGRAIFKRAGASAIRQGPQFRGFDEFFKEVPQANPFASGLARTIRTGLMTKTLACKPG